MAHRITTTRHTADENERRRVHWLAVKARALKLLADTPEKKRARESTARAKEMLNRLNRNNNARRTVVETERWIAAEITRQLREKRRWP